MPKEDYNNVPNYNSEEVRRTEDGAARGGQFIEIQDRNISKNDLMIISQVLHDRLDKLNTKAISLQKERDEFDVSSLEYSKLNYDIKINDIAIENTKEQINLNDDKILGLEDENNFLITNN